MKDCLMVLLALLMSEIEESEEWDEIDPKAIPKLVDDSKPNFLKIELNNIMKIKSRL